VSKGHIYTTLSDCSINTADGMRIIENEVWRTSEGKNEAAREGQRGIHNEEFHNLYPRMTDEMINQHRHVACVWK
jgi:hypothetical protein